LVLAVLLGLLTLFRAVKTSGVSALMQFEDIPVLHFANLYYAKLLWLATGLAVVFIIALTAAWAGLTQGPGRDRPRAGRADAAWPPSWMPWWFGLVSLPGCASLTVSLGLVGCRYSIGREGTGPQLHPAGFVGWTFVLLMAVTAWWLTRAITRAGRGISPLLFRRAPDRSPWLVRLSGAFLASFVALSTEAVWAHYKFWDPKLNGNYDYQQFFAVGERGHAWFVFLSCSGLFASVAALAGCAWYGLFHGLVGPVFNRPGGLGQAGSPSYEAGQAGILSYAGRQAGSLSYRGLERIPLLMAGLWVLALGVPWQIKLLPDVRNYQGWIMPAVVLISLFAALAPILATNLMMLLEDFGRQLRRASSQGRAIDPPKPSELAAWSLLLFPIYPLLRRRPVEPPWRFNLRLLKSGWMVAGLLLLPVGLLLTVLFPVYRHARWRRVFLMLLSGGMVGGLMTLVVKIDDWFTFDDWRHMLRDAEFPFCKVWLSLVAASLFYLCARRLAGLLRTSAVRQAFQPDLFASQPVGPVSPATPPSQPTPTLPGNGDAVRPESPAYPWASPVRLVHVLIVTAAAVCLAFSSWPFWGWSRMHNNVFARCVEFNTRHEFELSFLHWLLDCDRDGYSAVLHGADANDFNSNVQAGGLPAPEDVAVPVDRFALAGPTRARDLPNVAVLYLEGVVPRAIGAYGERHLPDGLQATPAMDSVAAEGTTFTQARCHYPSTWDAWYATVSGRFLRIVEMTSTDLKADPYSAHGNLYHVLKLAGIDRWCHADTAPYCQLLVPRDLHDDGQPAWKPESEFSSALTAKEEKDGMWRGDKRMKRMLEFLDDLKPGERFFITEHFCDTHFPWKPSDAGAAEKLGFPNGFGPYSQDAVLPNGGTDKKYSRYFESITRTDAQIGRFLKKLRQRKLYDSTIIVIVSDHGCQWWEHERLYYVSHIYEPSLRLPMIIRVPGLPGGGRCDEPVLQVDVLPTIMELLGVRHVNAEATGPLPGRSLVPALRSKASVPPALAAALRQRDVPLLTHYDMLGVLHDFRHKLIFNRPQGTYLLFDLQEDPGEMTNLADARPELLSEMLDRLRQAFVQNKPLFGRMK
jgi:hypothetical protein